MSGAVMEPSLDESEFATRVFGDLGEVRANPHDLETATVSAVVDGRPDVSCDRNVIDSMDGGAGGWKDGAKNMVVAQDHPLDAQVKHARPLDLPPSASSCIGLDATRAGADKFASLGAANPRRPPSQSPQQQDQRQQEPPVSASPAPDEVFGSNAESVVERWAPENPTRCEKPAAWTAGTLTSPHKHVSRAPTNPTLSSTAITTIISEEMRGTEAPHGCTVEQRGATSELWTKTDSGENAFPAGYIEGYAKADVRVRCSSKNEERQAGSVVRAGGSKMHANRPPTDLAGGNEYGVAADTDEADEVFCSINPLFVGRGQSTTTGVGYVSREVVGKELDGEANRACGEEKDTTPASSPGNPIPSPSVETTTEHKDDEPGEETTTLGTVPAVASSSAATAAISAVGVNAAAAYPWLKPSPPDGPTADPPAAGESTRAVLPPSTSSLPEGTVYPHHDSVIEEDRMETGASATNLSSWRRRQVSSSGSESSSSSSSSADTSISVGWMSSGSSGASGAFLAVPVTPVLLNAGEGTDCYNADDRAEVTVASSPSRLHEPAVLSTVNVDSISDSSRSSSYEGLRVFARVRSSARGGASAVVRLLSRRAKVAAAVSRVPVPPAPDASVAYQGRRLPPPPPQPIENTHNGGTSGTSARKLPTGFPPYAELFRRGSISSDKLCPTKGGGGGDGVLPALTGPGTEKGGVEPGGRRAPRPEIPGKTPLVSPLCSSPFPSPPSSPTASGTSSSSGAVTAAAAAGARAEVEGDVEEGGDRAEAASLGESVGPRVVAGGEVAAVLAAEVGSAAAEAAAGMVLPCAPSDEEKVLYHDSGRFKLVACALVAFLALSWGMWLFTMVMPAFYWFGAPAAFLVFYTAAHYMGVAIWGKDFKPGDHEEVLRRSHDRGYEPTVDVFLPVCNEPLHLLSNTWKHVSALDYPGDKLKIFVLDDGASEPVRNLAAAYGFEYVVRDNVPELKKAGNLRNAFARTSGEAIVIFDADFCPRADFLKETTPYLGEDPTIGIVQTPQFFRLREEQTWIEQGAGVSQEFFYRLVQMNQDRFNAAVCVGSCGLYRRAALEPLGGMAAIEHSEDMYTGYKMTENGFKIKYIPLALAMGICPDEPHSFFMQQYRWCKGSATLVTKREFWRSDISNLHKLCFLNGMLYYMATALLVFVAPLPILLLVWVAADGVLWYHSAFVLPAIVFAVVIMPMWSKQRYGMACHRTKIIQCYAHMFAIKDTIVGRSAPWIPSGRGRLLSSAYKSSVRLMVAWNVISALLIVGGSVWRMTELTWYHFVPAVVLAVGSFVLNMSTLIY